VTRRFARLAEIRKLDPYADHQRIYRLSSGFEFPWDYRRSLELALFRTYCVPSVSGLLSTTGKFATAAQRRYDDTALLMAELAEHGYDSARGREALRVINRGHARYPIGNDDMRYVLSTFVFEPIDWIARYGWRALSHHEKRAAFHFYREVGARMGIRDVPEDYHDLRQFKSDYERDHFRFAASNAEIGEYTVRLMCSWYPAPLRPVVRAGLMSLLDDRTRAMFGRSRPAPWIGGATRSALRARAILVRFSPPRRTSRLTAEPNNRTYPGYPVGYGPSDLARATPSGT
jgi:hypothetical protein